MTGIFCAIDTSDLSQAEILAQSLTSSGVDIKLGLEFFTAHGASGVKKIRSLVPRARIFLDLKLHDIPNTVAGAVRSALLCNVDYLTVHTSGGRDMLRAAVEAAEDKIKILGVTVLTTLDEADLKSVGQQTPLDAQVALLAALAQSAGTAGIICAPQEIAALRLAHGVGFKLVVPGIRPVGTEQGDQKRIMTPYEAAQLGADDLVIGRPITQSTSPAKTAQDILTSLTKCAA